MTRRQGLADVNVLDVVPVRLADWEDDGRQVVLIRPVPRVPWYLMALEWIRYLMAVRRIRLDETGSVAWRACDGRVPVSAVAQQVRTAFGDAAEPVEERVGHLIRRLREEGLLAYRDHDPIRHPAGRPASSDRGPAGAR